MSDMPKRVAALHITPRQPHGYETVDGQEFDARAYSLMKYGDSRQAWKYGQLIADAVSEEAPGILEVDRLVLTAPGAVYAPKPAMAIARSAMTHVNKLRLVNGIAPARLLRIYEAEMGDPSYANSSHADRAHLLSTRRHEHHIPPSLVRQATVLAIDDCIITGTTERSQSDILNEHEPAEVVFGYAVQVDKTAAGQRPNIEADLNSAAEPTLATIEELIASERFTLNSRALNFILSAEPADLSAFLRDCPEVVMQELYEATMNSTLTFIERHKYSVACLQRALDERTERDR